MRRVRFRRVGKRKAIVLALMLFVPLGATFAAEGWQPVVVYAAPDGGLDSPPVPKAVSSPAHQAPVMSSSPPAYTKPVPMRLPPTTATRTAPQEDAREARIINAPAGGVRAFVPINTGNNPEPLPASARQPASPAAAPAQAAPKRRIEPPSEDAAPGQQYCFNIADAAADARFAWQQRTLVEIEQELEKRVVALEEKTREYKTWLARREEFANKAQEGLMKIYARMRPDAAALQIAAMDEETAAAIMTKLDARASSAIMAEMDPQQAARLSATIAGAARTGDTREQAAANAKALQGERKQ